MVLRLLTIYFLWSAILRARVEVFGYDQRQILTYILLSQVLSATVFSTRTHEVGSQINQGDLSNFLLKPLNYSTFWWARDAADKFLNTMFAVVEVTILVVILRPPLLLQTQLTNLMFFMIAIILSMFLFFYISFLLSLLGFWTPDTWAPRFLFFVLTQFLAGEWFPLDILPNSLFRLLSLLPFSYLWFFPLKIYLGDLAVFEIIAGLLASVAWVGIFYFAVQVVWQRGLRRYEAQGR